MPEEKENVTEDKEDESKENNELYIGVNSDLTPFKVDLNALTRGLVVVGQSGCGKSFLIGRLAEELIRKTTEKTRMLIVDSNSDFCEGTRLKKMPDFKDLIGKYSSGLLTTQFAEFKEREMKAYNDLSSQHILPKAQLFGREEGFNLSWMWLVESWRRYVRIIKAENCPGGYFWVYSFVNFFIKQEYRGNPEGWSGAVSESLALKKGKEVNYKYLKAGAKPYAIQMLDEGVFLEFIRDMADENDIGIWRKEGEEKGLPDRLFADSRISFLEIEKIPVRRGRLEVVAFVLLCCLEEHKLLVETCRSLRLKDDEHTALRKAEQALKHTFILIDEVHNYAPEIATHPHETMLGNLIHSIAAEGRKYGVHLILCTQRPNKVRPGLLGECDNAVIMKMNSRSDLEHLAREMRILDVKLLESCLHFQGQGNAIAVGEMTRMAPYVRLFKSAPRRTVEGGVDIEGF